MKQSWFIRFPAGPRVKMRLFCFPYAGGHAHLFRGWPAQLLPSIQVVGIQAPGKGARALEQPHTSLDALVDDLLEAMRPSLTDGPFCFFGHSNGAMIAFELASRLQSLGLPLPERLLLSASPAPWTRVFTRSYSTMDEVEFKQVLRELEGTPAALFEDDELFKLMLPGLRADFALSESYSHRPELMLRMPVTMFYGTHDEIEWEKILAWQERISNPVEFREIAGGHFFIHTHEELLVREVLSRLGQGQPMQAKAIA